VRNVNTEVELAEGQSFAIGGLLDNRETETMQKIPFIGDVPILGRFFRSKQKNRTNTELIVIVTPQLVHPIPAGQPVPALKFPVPFLPPNTGTEMATPGPNVTGTPIPTAATPSIPVETLIKSMQVKPLQVNATTGIFGAGSTSSSSSGPTAPASGPAPTPAPPNQ